MSVYRDLIIERAPEGPYHCGTCGRMLVWVVNRFFHVLGSKRRFPPDSEMDYRIDHDVEPVPGMPEDRRDV